MSSTVSLEEKRKLELPRALREIVKLLAERGPMTYAELAEELKKDETTIIRQCQKLIEMEVAVKVEKEGKTAVALRDDIEVDEEGNVYVPSPFEDPIEKLKELLEEAGVKGRKLRWIMRLVESNPEALQRPEVLYDTLTGAGIRRQLAQQIVRAFFGTDFIPPTPTPQYPYAPMYKPHYGPPYYYTTYPLSPYQVYPHDREIMRLEMMLERLKDELKELRESRSSSAVPYVRRIKVDEQGRPVEVVEEPVTVMQQSRDTELLVKFFEARDRDKDRLYEMMIKMMDSIKELGNAMRESIAKLGEQMTKSITEIQRQHQEEIRRLEDKYREEVSKLREELAKKETEHLREKLAELMESLRSLPKSIREEVERDYRYQLELLKKEMEFEKKLRELESRQTLRDLTIGQIRKATEKIDKLADKFIEYMEAQMKQRVSVQVPKVSEEEKKKIIESLRKAAGKKQEERPQQSESIKVKIAASASSTSEECPSGVCREEEG